MTTNKLTNSQFFRLQNNFRAKQEEYRKLLGELSKKEEEYKPTIFERIKQFFGFNQ